MVGTDVISFILVVFFGSSSWMGTNSVWMQLPLLTSVLPEGWSLPSYLAMVVQIACIGPLVYGVLHKCCCHLSSAALVVAALVLAIICQSALAVGWSWTSSIFGGSHSLTLYIVMFGLALVNSTSNVLFMPFMAQYHSSLLTAYFVGMGLSSLVPSILSLIQGTSKYECVMTETGVQPLFQPPRFGVSIYLSIIAAWTVLATIAFIAMQKRDKSVQKEEKNPNESSPLRSPVNGENEEGEGEEKTARYGSRDVTEMDELSSGRTKETGTDTSEQISDSPSAVVVLLFLTALVNAQMNGVIPSIHSYAALPYSQVVYHLGLTLSNIASPLASFLPMFLSIRSLPILSILTLCSSVATACVLYLAIRSPHLVIGKVGGGILSVASVVVAAGLHSFLRTQFASRLREDGGKHSQNWLFWCGVFIQIGSFIGSAVMFPLVNFAGIFESAPMCKN